MSESSQEVTKVFVPSPKDVFQPVYLDDTSELSLDKIKAVLNPSALEEATPSSNYASEDTPIFNDMPGATDIFTAHRMLEAKIEGVIEWADKQVEEVNHAITRLLEESLH